MATNNFTTRTASLRATKIDTSKIILKGKNILDYISASKTKVLDDRGDFVTEQDLWGTTVTTDENGVVHVSHKFLNNPKRYIVWNSSVKSVKDDKAYTSTDASGEPLCNIQTEMIKYGSYMFRDTSLTSFSGNLSSLVDGSGMFYNTSLESFSGDLSSLVDAHRMFYKTSLKSFNRDLNILVNGSDMFEDCTSLESFIGDLSSLVNGSGMFADCTSLVSFIGDSIGSPVSLRSLVDGYRMFRNCTSLTSFKSDLSSLVNGSYMFYDTSLTSFSGNLSSLANGQYMFYNTSLTSFIDASSGLPVNLSSIVDGQFMFRGAPLTSFSGNLSSLVDGSGMFYDTSLTSFSGNLSSLIKGSAMFQNTSLESFSGNLSSLVDGSYMFYDTSLTSFNGDLSSLIDGSNMFSNTSLKSFSSDLSSLIEGYNMFSNTHKRGYTISHYKMVDGVKTKVTEHFRADGLTSFSGDLGSLQTGYGMFGDGSDASYTNEEGVTETTKDITPLDEQSVMIIADTIKDLNGFSDWDSSVSSSQRGIIHIGYDSTVCDAANIEEYCTEIMNKGWTVYLNGTLQTTDEGVEGIATTDENGTITVAPVHYYCKPVEVEQKDANWTDGEKYYIILGAQKVFGDDLSTYGMFTSIEDAAMNMGFTPYEYVEEEKEAQA